MKTPAWGYVVGIIMLVFGGCGAVKNAQSIMMPRMMDMQKDMYKNMSEMNITITTDSVINNGDSVTTIKTRVEHPAFDKDMAASMDKMMHLSAFTRTWMVRLGIIGFFPVAIYILAGIFLMVRRRFSIALAYTALMLTILFNIASIVILSHDSSSSGFLAMATSAGHIFGIVADFVLLIVVIASDKTAYRFAKG